MRWKPPQNAVRKWRASLRHPESRSCGIEGPDAKFLRENPPFPAECRNERTTARLHQVPALKARFNPVLRRAAHDPDSRQSRRHYRLLKAVDNMPRGLVKSIQFYLTQKSALCCNLLIPARTAIDCFKQSIPRSARSGVFARDDGIMFASKRKIAGDYKVCRIASIGAWRSNQISNASAP
jgi:hypothetical protein